MANTVTSYVINESTTNLGGTIEKGEKVTILFTSPDSSFAQVQAVTGGVQAYVPTSTLEGFERPIPEGATFPTAP